MNQPSCKLKGELIEKLVSSYDCKQGAIRVVRFNVDGNYCITGGSDKTLKLWNPFTETLLKTYIGHGNEVLDTQSSCDNAQLCSCSIDKTVILWDVASGNVVRKFRGHSGQVNTVCFNEDSSVILSGSIDGSIRVWDCRSKKGDPIQIMDEAKDSVTCLAVCAHEIVSGSADGRIRRYDIRKGELSVDFIGKSVTCVSLTADSQCVLVSTLDSTIRLFDKSTGGLLNEYSGHTNTKYRIDSCISSSDTYVISGSEGDGNVVLWDLIEAKVLSQLNHNIMNTVHSLSYHPKDTCLITACQRKIYVWKSRYGQTLSAK